MYPLFDRAAISWLFRDEFITAAAAPLASPRTCEPGPGTLVITDSNHYLSISGGKLVSSDATAAGDPEIASGSSFARTAGLAVFLKWQANATSRLWGFGFDELQEGPFRRSVTEFRIDQVYVVANDTEVDLPDTFTMAEEYKLAVIARSAGTFHLVKGSAEFASWTLIWVDNAANQDPLYAGVSLRNQTGDQHQIDHLRAAQLPAPFNSDNGLATDSAASPSASDTFTHEADCLIEFTVDAVPTANEIYVHFRAQDAANYWNVRLMSDGSMRLNEVVGGAQTQRGNVGAGLSGGERIVIIC